MKKYKKKLFMLIKLCYTLNAHNFIIINIIIYEFEKKEKNAKKNKK
jgi:hypothetical protein